MGRTKKQNAESYPQQLGKNNLAADAKQSGRTNNDKKQLTTSNHNNFNRQINQNSSPVQWFWRHNCGQMQKPTPRPSPTNGWQILLTTVFVELLGANIWEMMDMTPRTWPLKTNF
jgi:hypothetical protein